MQLVKKLIIDINRQLSMRVITRGSIVHNTVTKRQIRLIQTNFLTKMNQEKLVKKTINFAETKKKVPLLEENNKIAAKQVAEKLGGDVEKKGKVLFDNDLSADTHVNAKGKKETMKGSWLCYISFVVAFFFG